MSMEIERWLTIDTQDAPVQMKPTTSLALNPWRDLIQLYKGVDDDGIEHEHWYRVEPLNG